MLHFAVARTPDVLESLLGHGAHVNARDGSEETTPLLQAAFLGKESDQRTLEVLLQHAPDLSARTVRTNGGIGVMQAAGVSGASALMGLLEKQHVPLDLRAALVLGRVERVREILCGDPHAVGSYRPKPERLIIDAVLMLRYKVDLPARHMARHTAVCDTIDVLASILQQARGEPWFPSNPYWHSCLHQAVQMSTTEVAELLLRSSPQPIQGPMLHESAKRNRHCGDEMLALLKRYGVKAEGLPGANLERNFAVETLIERLRDSDPRKRFLAATSLGLYGKIARPAVAALRPLLTDSEDFVRRAATDALKLIDPDAVG
jgi:hypothetical protein